MERQGKRGGGEAAVLSCLACSSQVQSLHFRCLYWFHILVSLRSWIVVNKSPSAAVPLWPRRSYGGGTAALSLYIYIHLFCVTHVVHTYASRVGVAGNNTQKLFLSTLCNQWHTHICALAVSLTSSLDFLYAHINHHGPLGVVGFHQRGQVAAVHLLDVPQVGLAVVGHHFGALLVDVEPTVWQRGTQRRI